MERRVTRACLRHSHALLGQDEKMKQVEKEDDSDVDFDLYDYKRELKIRKTEDRREETKSTHPLTS